MKKLFITLIIILLSVNTVFATGTEALLFYNKALDYYKMGLYDEAITYFRKSIDSDPEFTDGYFNLGSVYEFLRYYDEALGVFKQLVRKKPDDYDAVYHAAWLSYKVGETDNAKEYLKMIPSTSERAQDARNLARQLGITPEFKQNTKPNSPVKNNDIYENITSPTGITADNDGNIYVAQFGVNAILKITPDAKKILYIKNPKINGPISIAFDSRNNLYIANYNDNNILKVSASGTVSEYMKNVLKPYGLFIKNDIMYITLQGQNSVVKYKLKF